MSHSMYGFIYEAYLAFHKYKAPVSIVKMRYWTDKGQFKIERYLTIQEYADEVSSNSSR